MGIKFCLTVQIYVAHQHQAQILIYLVVQVELGDVKAWQAGQPTKKKRQCG